MEILILQVRLGTCNLIQSPGGQSCRISGCLLIKHMVFQLQDATGLEVGPWGLVLSGW